MARRVNLIKRLLAEIQRQVFLSRQMQGLAKMQIGLANIKLAVRYPWGDETEDEDLQRLKPIVRKTETCFAPI